MDGCGVKGKAGQEGFCGAVLRIAAVIVALILSLAGTVAVIFGLITPFSSGDRLQAGNVGAAVAGPNVVTVDAPNNGTIPFGENKPFIGGGEMFISAEAGFLCTEGGQCVYSKNSSARLPMASITKVMTALVVLESGVPQDKMVNVSGSAQGVEGSSVYLVAGDRVTVGDLLYALMLSSANDAAVALAVEIGGDEEKFVGLMNGKASEIGMNDTSFRNPHGLSSEEHYTTARDYALLMSHAIKNPAFRELIGTGRKNIDINGNPRTVVNHNRLLYSCEGMIGGKTGYTAASGRTLVTAAERNGVTLICVTLNAPDDWDDHKRMYNRGFEVVSADTYTVEELSVRIPITGADGYKSITASPEKDIRLVGEAEKSAPEFKYVCHWFLYAPIYKGEKVGELRVYSDGVCVCTVELTADESAEARTETNAKKHSVIDRLRDFLKR